MSPAPPNAGRRRDDGEDNTDRCGWIGEKGGCQRFAVADRQEDSDEGCGEIRRKGRGRETGSDQVGSDKVGGGQAGRFCESRREGAGRQAGGEGVRG